MRILCIGCSWTEGWPHHLPESFNFHKSSLHGLGLGKIKQTFEDKGFIEKFDVAIWQLPTPIRTFWPGDTTDSHRDFVNSFEGKPRTAIRKLMKEYKDIILEINKLHPNVVFFLYNTGGYPLRHPFDFGKDIDKKFIEFFRENDLRHIYLSFEGLAGYCKQEEDCDDSEYKDFVEKNMKRILKIGKPYRDKMDEKYWVWQHPENRIIYDPHPSKRANKIAAKTVRDYIDEKYS